ncbi:oxysterol-binding protein-related protein 1D [Beta vulgaris subsp. vulgaris]|uniref:oxysterol-binding protein-related protein 1D n=1 Tax=Beta vulgaris subsp. vulgaris TaxID=3555 RepID=UPI002036B602|nr:oxysterol-binding protein-related protein 1D [Beta vulgaris subsp. vulgaris]
MNPLCCIAPVSVDREKPTSTNVIGKHPDSGFEHATSLKHQHHQISNNGGINLGFSRHSYSAQVSSVSSNNTCVPLDHHHHHHEAEDVMMMNGRDLRVYGSSNVVAGILYKWVNYGKGWRSRWFVLEDGVLSYYKLHGPDKIMVASSSPRSEKNGVRVIGEESVKYLRKNNSWGKTGSSNNGNGSLISSNNNGINSNNSNSSSIGSWVSTNSSLSTYNKHWKPFGEVHLKVSSVRASKSDDKRLSIFTGTKTLHLRCVSKEDRAAWIEALLAAKDLFPRVLASNDFAPEEIAVSTEKLRRRMLQEGIAEPVINDCESIMLIEVSELQNQFKALQRKHVSLLKTLRQLETEKIELETTVVDETKRRDSCCGQGNRRFSDFYSIMSEGSGSDSDVDNESQDGVDAESDEEDGAYFDTNDYLASEFLRSASCRGRESFADACSSLGQDCSQELQMGIRPAVYPYINRRDSFPEPKEKEKPMGLWSIIKDNIGKDLSGVCLPVYFNEPLSSLQKCFEDLEYSHLVDQALEWGKLGNDLMRILHVAAFAVSGYASTEGRQCKPFNPLLGETYEADYPDKGLRFFSEKVSHHPMVVACHCEGRGWKFWADSNLKGKFWGRSIQLDPVGILTLQFEDGETFQWSKVTTSIYNIIIGKIYCDHYGTMRIKGSGNYSCKLKFKEQSIIDRNPHQVHGFVQDNRTGEKVAMLVGKWDEAIYYVLGDPTTKPKGYDPMTEAVLLWERDKSATKTRYNLTPFAISLNELIPGLREKLPPTDSRLRPDQRHLENGEYELANAEKLRLEQLQRQARRIQESGWQPRWFKKDEDGCYRYMGGYWETREQGNWEGILDIFGQRSDIILPCNSIPEEE